MSGSGHPILDNHVHLDPLGLNLEAAKRFERAGGTHLIVSHKPYSDIHVNKGEDYRTSFDKTLDMVELARNNTGLMVYATVGPYPVGILALKEKLGLDKAKDILLEGMDIAKQYVVEGKAIAIGEVGRPHFPVNKDIMDASNEIIAYGMVLAKEAGCPIVLHTESAKEDDHIPGLLRLGKDSGIPPEMMIKHFSPAKLADPEKNLGITPSIVSRKKSILKARRLSNNFLMETDYMDSLERPDAVLPPETVPVLTLELMNEGIFSDEDVFHIHKDLPERLYGIDMD